jgi:hypothetical protein
MQIISILRDYSFNRNLRPDANSGVKVFFNKINLYKECEFYNCFFRYAISSDRSGGFALEISVKYLTNRNAENTADYTI